MIDYNLLSQEEAKQLLFLNLQLDEEVIEKYFIPRWQFFKEQGYHVFQQKQGEQHNKEVALAFLLLIAEPYTRSQVKNILSTSLEDKDIAAKLRPFHRDIQDLLEYSGKEIVNFSAPMVKIVLREKEPYQRLLEELTTIIRQHSPNTDKLVFSERTQYSPVNDAAERVQKEIVEHETQKKKEKRILITVKPSDQQKVLEALLPYVDPEQDRALSDLLSSGSTIDPVYFKGNNRQLGDFFRRLKDKGILSGISYFTELADWLSQHFFFWNKDEGNYTPVKTGSILKVLQDGDKPKTSINF